MSCLAPRGLAQTYDMAIRSVGSAPEAAEPVFADNVQGITTDGNFWFITQTEDVWRFPIARPWTAVAESDPDVLHTELDDYKGGFPFVHDDYVHMGDLTYHDFCGLPLIVVPLHDGADHPSAMLVLRATDLGAVGYQEFWPSSLGAFCATDDEGVVYFPGVDHHILVGYRLDCDALAGGIVSFVEPREVLLTDEQGNLHARHHKQGGAFSPAGDLFVMSTGFEDENSDPVLDGLHVFDTTTWQRVAHSTNGGGLFDFEWNPFDEEPEGIVWIDLDSGLVPGMTGQLHVLHLDNDPIESDCVSLWHYSSRIYVDADATPGDGTIGTPFASLGPALELAWDRCEIRLAPGSYPTTGVISTRLRLHAPFGGVTVGN